MSLAFSRTWTLALATMRDLLRRPGAWLALAAFAVVLLIVPRLARRALDDGAALGTELVLSTTWLYASVFAAIAGVRAAQPTAAMGPSAEILTTPLGRGEYVLGRAGGVAGAALAHAAGLLIVGGASLALGASAPEMDTASFGAALMGGVVQVAFFAAAGLAAGALCGGQLASVLVMASLIAARLVFPGLTALDAAWTWWVPDPARLELSREVAFGRALNTSAVLGALGAGVLQTFALLALARIGLAAGARHERVMQSG